MPVHTDRLSMPLDEYVASPKNRLSLPIEECVASPVSACSPRTFHIATRRLKWKDINLMEPLGSGGFGTVFRAKMFGQHVAVKKIHEKSKNPKALRQSFQAELNVLQLDHPHIVQTLSTSSPSKFHPQDGAFIVMEYVEGRNLLQIINDNNEAIDQTRRLKYCLQIARAIEFTHSSNLVHLDIKPSNIMVTMNDICKLGDFGCCQMVDNEEGKITPTHRSYLTGTFAYRAPELLKGDKPTLKADIYSFAITMWQLLSRTQPYVGKDHHVAIFAVVAYNLRPDPLLWPESDTFERSYFELYTSAWSASTATRPTSAETVKYLENLKVFEIESV